MKRTIAIGDIHGCNKTLRKLLLENLQITEQDTLIFLGDYIDKGPDSAGVINTMLALLEMKYNVHFLRGNHEQMLLDSEYGFTKFSHFIENGGDKTLENYDVDFLNEMPQTHQDFYTNTKLFIELDNYIFVHAGLNFNNDDIFEDKEAMLWGRHFARHQPKLGDRLMIHGHTPLRLEAILKQHTNCINIDGGCVYNNEIGFGYLVAYIVEEQKYVVEPNCEA